MEIITKEILIDYQKKYWDIECKKDKLFIIFGLLGDFDSIEYAKNISNYIRENKNLTFDIFAFAIGSEEGKAEFCNFTEFPIDRLIIFNNNNLHKTLNLYSGIKTNVSHWIDFLLMLSGIGSSGTLKEVLRGYIGDKSSKNIFKENDSINIGSFIKFKGSLFQNVSKENYLRPFELATYRLINMEEIIIKWNKYIYSSEFLTQRGGTFLLNKKNDILYEYRSKAILNYSETMNEPLLFIKNIYSN